MKKVLYLAEKPNTIEAVATLFPGERKRMGAGFSIGNNYFAPLAGHVLRQGMPDDYLPDDIPRNSKGNKIWRWADLPILPQQWKLIPDPGKTRYLDTVRDFLPLCDEVVHLGDADEEGQLLVDEVLEFFGNRKPVMRALITDYNTQKVREAMSKIKPNTDPVFVGWYKWALARSHYDWLFGMNPSRAFSLKWQDAGGKGVLPVGSVQTPLLKIIVDRDRAIENFKPVPFFAIAAKINHEHGEFVARWKAGEDQDGLDSDGRLIDENISRALVRKVSGQSGNITLFKSERKKTPAPLLYSQSLLAMEANDKHGFSAAQVLEASQLLYDNKLLSYPRVDIQYVYEVNHEEAPAILQVIASNDGSLATFCAKADTNRKSAAFDDSKIKVHHAILPTMGNRNISDLPLVAQTIYRMVCARYIAQFYPEYEYLNTVIEAAVAGEKFVAIGKTPQVPGWHVVLTPTEETAEESPDENQEQRLPTVEEGDAVHCVAVQAKDKKTSPPPRFTEKLLLQAMADIHQYVTIPEAKKRLKAGDGIGTEATKPAHIEGLKDSGYITPIKAGSRQYISTSPARALIDALNEEVKDPGTAGLFKIDLDRVASGELAFEQFMRQTEEFVTRIVEQAKQISYDDKIEKHRCPRCESGNLRRINGSRGPFWSCSNYQAEPPCKATFPDSKGKPVLDAAPICPACKVGELRRIKGANGFFWGCSRYKEGCTRTMDDQRGKPVERKAAPVRASNEYICPDCGKPLVHRHKPGQGGYDFFGCSGYPSCKSSFKSKAGKPEFKTS